MANYALNFSRNLRRLRREHDMTQKSLADACGYSEKTVSKWECAESIPSIETLFMLANLFCTDIEALFSDESEFYYLGIDGGGTKTELALADADGTVIRTLKTTCSNPMDIGAEKAKSVLTDAIHKICHNIPLSSVCVFAGIAGGTSGGMKEVMTEFFGGFHFRAFQCDSDNQNIIAAGLGEKDGITLILGTGICVFSQVSGIQARVAGWGYYIDNGGSAYNIGRDALNAYYCELDGSGPRTAITDEIQALGVSDPQLLLGKLYAEGKKTIASFASAVFRAADVNDGVALAILERNIAAAAHCIETAASRFESYPIPVIVAGGMTNEPILLDLLCRTIRNPEQYQFRKLECAPVSGAVKRAMELGRTVRLPNT